MSKDFGKVEVLSAYDCENDEGRLMTHFYGGDGEFVRYEDYEELLNAYKELKHRMEGLEK